MALNLENFSYLPDLLDSSSQSIKNPLNYHIKFDNL